jgi:hypothetical protein
MYISKSLFGFLWLCIFLFVLYFNRIEIYISKYIGEKYLAIYMGMLSPKLDVDVILFDVADRQ